MVLKNKGFLISTQSSALFLSPLGTVVMRVNATDQDEENTPHTKLYFTLDKESEREGMFYINHETGDVMVKRTSLDREVRHFTDLSALL